MFDIAKLEEIAEYLRIEVINREAGFSDKLLLAKIHRNRKYKRGAKGDGDGRLSYFQSQKLEPIFDKIVRALSNRLELPVGMPSELLPCPFCGGKAEYGSIKISNKEIERLNERSEGHFVNCIMCGSNNNSLALGYDTKEKAKYYWNKRASR